MKRRREKGGKPRHAAAKNNEAVKIESPKEKASPLENPLSSAKKENEHEEQKAESSEEKDSAFSRILTLALAVILTLVFVGSEIFGEAEKSALKWMARFNSLPSAQNRVVIVDIDDDDYDSLFQRKSPLNPERLQEIIQAVSIGKPKVIGIDIDTSDQSFANLKPDSTQPPIVWAQTVDFDEEGEMVCCVNPLGGQKLLAKDKTVPPILPKDEDSVSRRYKLFFEQEDQVNPTFIFDILSIYNPSKYEKIKENTAPFFIKFAGDVNGSHRLNISASELLEMSKNPDELKEKLAEKIVLLGGTYAEAKDSNETPLGVMHGIKILASSIETELTNTGLKSPNKWYRFLISLFEALFFIFIFNRFKFKHAVLICLLSVLPLTIILSFLVYGSAVGFVYFLPTLCLVVIYMIGERIKEYQKDKVTESYAIGKESFKKWFNKDKKTK